MTKSRVYSLASLFVVLGLGAFTAVSAALDYPLAKPQTAVNSGNPAPEFTLNDQDGNSVSLSSFRGHKVLLMFYRAHWCPYCMAQLADVAKHKAEFERIGVKVVAVSLDTQEYLKKVHSDVVKKQFPVLGDPEGRVVRAYGLLDSVSSRKGDIAIRTSVLIDENGVEQWRRVSESAADNQTAAQLLERIQQSK